MYNNILVSVIIPNYNHALFLKQRIDSVINQTFQNFEIIILDDCSIDNSREIIEQYRSNPKVVNILYNKENSGSVFKQWIKGIENAKGEYVWIAESDDYAAENFLEETVNIIHKDSSIGMVFTNSNTIDSKDNFLRTSAESKKNSIEKLKTYNNIINKDNVTNFLVEDMVIENASSALFRKKSLEAIDFNELSKFINTGDRFVYIGIALESSIKYIPIALNFMRSHENNTTKKSFENGNIHRDRIRVLNYYFHKIFNTPSEIKIISNFYKEHYLLFTYYGNYNDNLELLKKIKQKNIINSFFYYAVWFYVYLFKKNNIKSRVLRSIYYRFLLLFNKNQ